MASDFMKILAKDVLFQYPKMDQTYHWDSAEQRSVPCAPSAQNAAWSIGFLCSAEQAKEITDQCKEHYAQCKARNPKLGKLSKVFGMKKNDDGTVTFAAKRNAKKKNGEANDQPTVIDGNKQPLADRRFWSGSTGSLSFLVFPVNDPDGNLGISMLVGTVQVANAIYGDAGDDFDVVPGSVTRNEIPTDNDDPFGLPNQSTPSAPAPTPDYDLDDEIPF